MRTVAAVDIDGTNLSLATVKSVACEGLRVELAEKARAAMRASRDVVDQAVAADGQVYGVTTGFGRLKNVRIAPAEAEDLQRNLILSHCAGVGDPLAPAVARAGMLLRAHSLARGYSGVRIELVQLLLDMLNADLAAVIPSKGSVGCSGDLAPLAHMALTLMGEGHVWSGEARLPASEALQSAGLRPIRLSYKEGISLINGTQIMTAIGVLALLAARSALKALDIAGAMSLEAFLGSDAPFAERINALRPYRGQARSASNLRHLLAGSEVVASHRNCDRVQDPYSFRCMPVVHGAARDTLAYGENVLEIEINAVTDNPIVFADDGVLVSNGNFHGGPVGLALDYVAIALTDASSISERRCYKLLEGLEELPPFLSERFGMCSGYMLAQYTAAALVSENKTLAVPASTDSIPTSAGQEDHNSMGTISARQCASVVENFQTVVAIELLEAAQALDFRSPLRYGRGTAIAHRIVRERVPHLAEDRNLSIDIEAAIQLVRSGALVAAVEDEIGSL